MNYEQIKKYRVEWALAKRILSGLGLSADEIEARRHELHVKALGTDKSSTLFTDKEMDAVLREFRAISKADDLTGQIELGDMGAQRKRHGIGQLLDAVGLGSEFVEQWLDRRRRAGRMLTLQGPTATFETVGLADLEPLYIDLKKACRRRWPRKGDLLTEIRVMKMSHEFHEETTRSQVCGALGCKVLPELHDLDYEALLIVIATLRRMMEVPF